MGSDCGSLMMGGTGAGGVLQSGERGWQCRQGAREGDPRRGTCEGIRAAGAMREQNLAQMVGLAGSLQLSPRRLRRLRRPASAIAPRCQHEPPRPGRLNLLGITRVSRISHGVSPRHSLVSIGNRFNKTLHNGTVHG